MVTVDLRDKKSEQAVVHARVLRMKGHNSVVVSLQAARNVLAIGDERDDVNGTVCRVLYIVKLETQHINKIAKCNVCIDVLLGKVRKHVIQ